MSLNDLINQLGNAIHQAAQTSQAMENELKYAESRVAQISELDEKAKALKAEVAELSATRAALQAQVDGVKAEKQKLLEALK